jgi:predicted CXXCH cytochrome family protein
MTTRERVIVILGAAGLGLVGAGLASTDQAQPGARRGAVAPPTTMIERGGCVTTDCHPGIKESRFLHGPVHVNACDSCHTLTDPGSHSFTMAREREEVCTFCHIVDRPDNSVMHAPFEAGECLSCHDPHGSPERAMLRGTSYAESCNTCHTDATGAHTSVHGPVAAGACGACHEPHHAPHEGLLTREGRDLCLNCHQTVGAELNAMHNLHEPLLGDCRACHDPHATDVEGILHDDPQTLCTACHTDIAQTIGEATTQHAAVTTEQTCLNCHAPHASNEEAMLLDTAMSLCFDCHDTEIELPDGRVLANMQEVISNRASLHGPVAQGDCTACHDIHGGGHERLLTQEYPSSIYYPYTDNAYALCFTCHDRQLVLTETSDAVTGFRNGEQNLHYVHVYKDGRGRSCRVCHDSHASDLSHHLRESIPYGPSGWELPIGFTPTQTGGSCNNGCHKPWGYDRVERVLNERPESDESWRGRDLRPDAGENETDAGDDS